jgi:hypothetical protein
MIKYFIIWLAVGLPAAIIFGKAIGLRDKDE